MTRRGLFGLIGAGAAASAAPEVEKPANSMSFGYAAKPGENVVRLRPAAEDGVCRLGGCRNRVHAYGGHLCATHRYQAPRQRRVPGLGRIA